MQPSTLAFAFAGLLAALPAQSPLNFDVLGGSMPGSVSMDLYPGSPFTPCLILTGVTAGPTPIALFDPVDPRSVNVGTEILGNSMFGLFGLDQHFRIPGLAVPASPSFLDMAFFFQGVNFPGQGRLVDQISLPRVVRIGNAGTFRDRLVSFQDERAFATTLGRTDGRWMVVGGGRGGLLALTAHRTTSIYDPLTDGCTPGPQLTVERALYPMVRLQDGRFLIPGGVNRFNDPQASCEIHDPATDTFTAVAPMLHPRAGHTATLLPDGRVFAAGGLIAMTVTPSPLYAIFDTTNTTEIYNPATNSWTAGPNLRTPRVGHAAIVRPDNVIALCGGISWDNLIIIQLPAVRSTVDLYNPATNAITAGPSMGSARSLIDPIPLGNDRWLMAGGINAVTLANQGTPTNTAEVYDAVANTWSPAGAMTANRGLHKGWALGGGRFLIAGGADGTLQAPIPHATTEIYHAATNSWSAGPAMTMARTAFATFAMPTGQVMLFGGGTSGGTISNGAEFFYF